jgi:N-acetylmuramoyl-L-alanine amidase
MIVIDAGHGGSDPGASVGSVVEKHLALIYSMSLGGELCRLNVPVIYTRTSDTYPTLGDRTALANEKNAAGFVSVHFNASANRDASGIWLLHAAGAPGGQGLAEAIQKKLGGKVYPDGAGWTNGRGLAVLRRTRMPAVLLEYGFLTNAIDRENVQAVAYMRLLIEKTAAGIVAWMKALG